LARRGLEALRHKILIFLSVALVASGMAILQFSWWLSWFLDFEYGHEVGCVMVYAGLAILLAEIAWAIYKVAEALWRVAQAKVAEVAMKF